MPDPFRSFVIFAGMRTGSNLLEATLNAIKYVTCFGEAFNPYMLGWPDKAELKGFTAEQRDADPHALLNAILGASNLNGFRYFFDHDPRVFDAIMDDPSCGKIILTRNPVDSYVSTQLARETNQWKLNETETPIPARITFDPAEFRETLDANIAFLTRIQRRLQTSGQAGFWLSYDDLRDPEVMTGMMHWLGRTDLAEVRPASDQVPQNPRLMAHKVENFEQMQAELARIDPFQLHKLPNFEVPRSADVSTFSVVDGGRGLLFQPIFGGPTRRVERWLGSLGPVRNGLSQAELAAWKRDHPGHRSFTSLAHPTRRAWTALCVFIDGPKQRWVRDLLRERQRVPVPPEGTKMADLDAGTQRALFLAFLDFVGRNLNGQTTMPTHRLWASQSEIVAGFVDAAVPHVMLRDDALPEGLAWLCDAVGVDDPPELSPPAGMPDFLTAPEVRAAAHEAYLRDYVAFGFDP
ncbi:hypothetical protein DRW48_02505 [Paracoccus suum]|uniref:Nodulation protein NodH n=1 Tax=Paracoccus suum TaxID=2259340 RepID=A0A344PH54_9RHOB|nr:hypothetical protein [Paracoccus suum]AXC48709.1 hypothetical protein DRW48_02505 [Paracoccus suum]